jgi:putative inorganic carbon (hco3(-)) transporter
MAYALCILYIVVIYVRPGEIVPAWAELSITLAVGAVAAMVTGLSIVLRPRPIADSPVDWCFLGFCVIAILSNPAHGWFGGGLMALRALLPLVLFYFLIRTTVQSKRQLQVLVAVIVLLALFQAGNGIVQYYTGSGIGGSTAMADSARLPGDEYVDRPEVNRIRGTGIFSDPNDLAMSMVLVFPFLFTAVLSPSAGLLWRSLAVGATGVLAFAVILTRSRGGLVGLAALCAAYGYRRFGRRWALLLIVILVVVLGVAFSGKQMLDPSESSSQGRVQAWSAGLQMLKSNPVIGVGFGGYTEYNELVAHNSFVHSLAELGLTGGFFFVGMFYWFLTGTGARRDVAGAASSPLAMDLWASGLGVIACATFLSRQYTPVLYVPIALGATRMAVEQTAGSGVDLMRRGDWTKIVALTLGLIVVVYVVVRIFAVWSR